MSDERIEFSGEFRARLEHFLDQLGLGEPKERWFQPSLFPEHPEWGEYSETKRRVRRKSGR
jgi:hypothetical protein